MTDGTLALFSLLSFAAAVAGGRSPAVARLTVRFGSAAVLAFRSGLLIAVAGFDVLPEAWRTAPGPAAAAAAGALTLGWRLHGGGGDCAHDHSHPHLGGASGLAAAVAALAAHSLLDGLNLGAMAAVGGPAMAAVGAATVLHKLADGFTLSTLFQERGRPGGETLAWLTVVSLATPLGALCARAGELRVGPSLSALLLGFAGGSFLYVGLAQAVPGARRASGPGPALSFGGGLAAMLVLRRLAS